MPAATPTPSTVLCRQLAAVRGRKGWTQQQLAGRLKALRFPLDRTAISKIEKQLRGVSLDEALALAAALEVAPTALFLPRDGSMVEVTPRLRVDGQRAAEWIRGHMPLGTDEEPVSIRTYWDEVSDVDARAWRRGWVLSLQQIPVGLAKAAARDDREAMRLGLEALEGVIEQAKRELDFEEATD